MNVLVRPEHSSDAAAIDHVLRSAFPTDQEARLVDRLRNHQRLRLSLVAEVDRVIVGHIAFSAVTIAGSVAKLVRQEFRYLHWQSGRSCSGGA